MKNALAAALATLGCAAPVPGVAQGTAPQPAVLPEVSVSATRVARDSMDLPVAIDTIDQRAIRETNPQVNLSESLNRVPGIAVLNRQTGAILSTFGRSAGQFHWVHNMASDSHGNLYTAEVDTGKRVQRFVLRGGRDDDDRRDRD